MAQTLTAPWIYPLCKEKVSRVHGGRCSSNILWKSFMDRGLNTSVSRSDLHWTRGRSNLKTHLHAQKAERRNLISLYKLIYIRLLFLLNKQKNVFNLYLCVCIWRSEGNFQALSLLPCVCSRDRTPVFRLAGRRRKPLCSHQARSLFLKMTDTYNFQIGSKGKLKSEQRKFTR